MPAINVRDTSLYYETAGRGETTLLFIHGMCGGAWNWEDQMNRLSPEFTCVAYDRRGHSRSEAGSEDQSNRTHVEDAAALIEALGLDRPILVASSGGANVAIEVLQRFPHLVRGAVLSEPPLFSVDPDSGKQLVGEIGQPIRSALERGDPRGAVDAFFEIVCPYFWAQIDESRRDRVRDNAPMLVAALESEGPTIRKDELGEIRVPVLIISGEKTLPFAHAITRILAEGLPDARSVEFEDCGHVTYAEKPAEFARAVTTFVHEITGTNSASERLVNTSARSR